jgi:hypothetical protein
VHRVHNEIVADSEKSIRLHQLKWPIENLYICFRPRSNLTSSQNWHKPSFITSKNYKEAVVTGVATIQVNNAVYYGEQHCISKLSLLSNDIVIYPELQPEFYNNYIPLRYGAGIKTPKQLGWYMINFALNPGDYQPSGYLNVSLHRELYLKYTSAIDSATGNYIIRSDNPVDLIVLAEALNFLLVKDGNAALRFST